MFVKIITRKPSKGCEAEFKLIECINAEVADCPFNNAGENYKSVKCSLSEDNADCINYRITSSVYFISNEGVTVARYHSS